MQKPKFDPSKPYELAQPNQTKPKFDPNQPFRQAEPSQLEAAGRGALQGVTAGHGDELEGAARGIFDDLKSVFSGGDGSPKPEVARDEFGRVANPEKLTGTYAQHRDRARDANDAAREAHPWTYGGAELAGGVSTAFVPGVSAVRGASLANIAARSAAFGGVAGAGYSEADDIGGVARDTVMGATIGAALPPALRGVGMAGKGAVNVAAKGGRKVLSSFGGVSEDVIERYLKNPERIRNAKGFDELYDEVSTVVRNLSDDFDNAKINYNTAKNQLAEVAENIKHSRVDSKAEALDQVRRAQGALDDAFKATKQNISEKASPSRLEPLVGDALEGLKARVNDGIEVANEALAVSSQSIKSRSLITPLRKLSTDLGKDFADDAVLAKAKVDKYIGILKESGGELSLPDARRFMKNMREDVGAWSRDAGGHTGIYDRSLKQAQGIFDKRLKGLSPEYDATMAGVAEDMKVLDSSRKLFGKEQTRLSRLEGVWRPSARTQRDALKNLADKQGGEMPKAVDKMIDAQRTLKSPARLESVKQQLPETKILRKAEMQAASTTRAAKPRAIKEAIKRSAEFHKAKSAKARAENAKQVANKFRSFGEQGAEAKLKQVARGNKFARKTLEELSALSDKDFVAAVDAAADASAFTKKMFNGSRNVNLWSTMGILASSIMGKSGVGAAGGFLMGGPVGMAFGAAVGATMDQYGPRVTKKILDGMINTRGKMSEAAIRNFDVPEKVKLELIQGFRNSVSAKAASGASSAPSQVRVPHIAENEERPKLKGQEKWASDGLKNLIDHSQDPKTKEALKEFEGALFDDPKAKKLLIEASSLKPNSKKMDRVFDRLSKLERGE